MVGLPGEQAYPIGDLNQDFVTDAIDYELFKAAYALANGVEAAARDLPESIPEPVAAIQFAVAMCLITINRRKIWLEFVARR